MRPNGDSALGGAEGSASRGRRLRNFFKMGEDYSIYLEKLCYNDNRKAVTARISGGEGGTV